MKMRKAQWICAVLLATTASIAFGTACTMDEARRSCEEQFSKDEEINACVFGATQTGSANGNTQNDLKEADKICARRYDAGSTTYLGNESKWFDQAGSIADLFNACHRGAEYSLQSGSVAR